MCSDCFLHNKMGGFIFCSGKYDYKSITSKPWDWGIQWLADSVKRKHKGTSLPHHKITTSAKPEMKSDSFNKMSICPRRAECLNTLENLHLEG